MFPRACCGVLSASLACFRDGCRIGRTVPARPSSDLVGACAKVLGLQDHSCLRYVLSIESLRPPPFSYPVLFFSCHLLVFRRYHRIHDNKCSQSLILDNVSDVCFAGSPCNTSCRLYAKKNRQYTISITLEQRDEAFPAQSLSLTRAVHKRVFKGRALRIVLHRACRL